MTMRRKPRRLHLLALCALAACAGQPRKILITATEYQLDAPAEARPGPTVFRFRNAGEVRHEVIIVRMKPGITLRKLLATPPGPLPDPVVDGGTAILLADPGNTDDAGILIDLVPGATYALFCTLRDAPAAKRHFELGEARTLRVQ